MADVQSGGKQREADDEALVAFQELRARVELNDSEEAISLDLLDSPVPGRRNRPPRELVSSVFPHSLCRRFAVFQKLRTDSVAAI